MKKVLLLGGTGAMGIYLAPECLRLGYEVYITSRSYRTATEPGMHFLTGNAHDIEFLRGIASARCFDAIVDFMVYDTQEFANRVETLLGLASHYVFVSTYRVFADSGVTPLTESSPRLLDVSADVEYLKTDEYALTKARQEDVLRQSPRKNWTIVRPSITYSTFRFQFGTLEADLLLPRALENIPVVMAMEVMDKLAAMTWAGDVAKMIGRLILNPQAYAQDFNVVSSERRTWREVAECYKKIIGLDVIEVPLAQFKELAGNPWQLKYDRMFNRVCNNNKVLSATGICRESLMPLYEGLALELERNRKTGKRGVLFTEVGGRMDRVLGIRQKVKAKPPVKDWLRYLSGRVWMLDFFLSRYRAGRRLLKAILRR